MIKAVIFDVDGTLVDSVDMHAKAWQQTFAEFGRDLSFDEVRAQIGKGSDQLMPVFLSDEEIERRGKEMDEFRSALFKREYLPQVRGFPRVRELFERIKRDGLAIALGSSAKGDELQHYKRVAGIEDLVESETTADDAEKSKPEPDIFEAAVEQLKPITADEAIVIGDTPYDAIAAGKAGLKTIGLLCGGFPEEDLRRAGCIEIYRDPGDLLDRYPFARL